jgi:chaperonin GroES
MINVESIVPQFGRVLVQTKKQEEKTKGGILLPGKLDQKFKTATVKAVGTGKRLEDGRILENAFKEGQEVMFGAFSGTTIDEDNGYVILNEEEVYAIIK